MLAPALIALHVLLAWIARAPMMLTRQDDARYLGLARALQAGSYRDFMWPGAPLHHLYPPGYPAVLAAWTAVGGEGFDWIIVLQILISVATLALVYDTARRALGLTVALGTLAILSVNPSMLEASGQIASEGALAFCCALAIWASVAMEKGTRQSAVLIASALAAPMMRTAGVVLPAALVLHWLWQRRYRDAAVATTIFAVVVGALFWWTFTDPNAVAGSSYAGDITLSIPDTQSAAQPPSLAAELLRRVKTNLIFYSTQGISWILPLPTFAGTPIDNVAGLALIVIGLGAGLWRTFRQWQLAMLLVVCTGGLVLVWPFQIVRYLAPALPQLVPVMLLGLVSAFSLVRARPWAVVAVAAVVICGTGLSRVLATLARGPVCGTEARPAIIYNCATAAQAAFFSAAAFVRDSLPADARILSAKSEPLYIVSNHITSPLVRIVRLDSASFWGVQQRERVEYILLGDMQAAERPYLAPLLEGRCRDLELVRMFTPTMLLFHRAPATAPQGSAACQALARYRELPARP